MWHKVNQVAKTHRFDEAKFFEFAAANIDWFSLIEEDNSLLVNTWNVDSLIDSFINKRDTIKSLTGVVAINPLNNETIKVEK